MVKGADGQPGAEDDVCPHCGHGVGDSWLVCAWCGETLAVAAELTKGVRLDSGRYQILNVLGRGGFGITYDVGDRRLQRRVAMKELFPDSAVRHGSMVLTPPQGRAAFKAARERFLREARVLARFTHPGIVRVYEVFEEHGTAYLVMELLEGRTLIELLQQRGKPFPERDLLDVAGRVAAAMRPVHAAGVLHRDINPSNVMVTHHGRVVVIDFGLARDYDQEATMGMTRVVTPGYAPLEQYRGEGRFGPSTDVYGLAATLYRLATGRVPVSAIERDAGAPLPSAHTLNPAISKSVSDAILDGLEIVPEHRPQDLDSFLSRLGISGLPQGPRSTVIDLVPLPASPSSTPKPASPRSPQTPPMPRPPVDPPPATAPQNPKRPTRTAGPDQPRANGRGADLGDPTVDQADRDATFVVPRPARAQPTVVDPDVTHHDERGIPRSVGTEVLEPHDRPHPMGPPAGIGYLDRRRSERGSPDLGMAEPPKRRWLTLPLLVSAVAAGSAAPVITMAIVVGLLVPWFATLGDSAAQRRRGIDGARAGWAEQRMSPAALAGPRFVRNVLVSVFRSLPALGLLAVLLLGYHAVKGLDPSPAILHGLLRIIGATCALISALHADQPSGRFRSHSGIDEAARWALPGGRFSERILVVWILLTAVIAGSLWLDPTAFPFP